MAYYEQSYLLKLREIMRVGISNNVETLAVLWTAMRMETPRSVGSFGSAFRSACHLLVKRDSYLLKWKELGLVVIFPYYLELKAICHYISNTQLYPG